MRESCVTGDGRRATPRAQRLTDLPGYGGSRPPNIKHLSRFGIISGLTQYNSINFTENFAMARVAG
jgi:hypothetical protein